MSELSSAAGNLIGGFASYESGKYNKAVNETQAVEAERDGTVQESRIREAARAAIGQQVAAQGSNGFQAGSGSAIDALMASQVNATLDALTVRRAAASNARSLRVKGAIAKAAGDNALTQGMFGAAGNVADYASTQNQSRTGQSGGGGGSKTSMGSYDASSVYV